MRVFFILFLFAPLSLLAQFTYELNQSISVFKNSELLKMPWAGGLNAAQYNSMDVNGDGANDLVIYDRTSNKINVFVAEGTTYQYAPDFEHLFPEGINNWLIIRDYNCDGLADIFTSSPFGITTYINIGDGSAPAWQVDANPVNTVGTSGLINLKINGNDLPAIEDIDGDGDLDIITFGFTGGGEAQYHQNMSMENHGDCNTLEFVRVTSRWGDFEECQCGTFAFGTDDCPPQGGREEHVAGKSLLAYDADDDGDYDLVIGEQGCSSLSLLENVGDKTNAIMANPVLFPEIEPAVTLDFPAAYHLDVDLDGKKDIVISTNSSSNSSGDLDFEQSNLFYKGAGNSQFSLITNAFLQEQMIDVGYNSSPAFYDVDNDGDKDMLLTSSGQSTSEGFAKVTLYENTGTRQMPEFTLQDEDYLEVSSLQLSGLTVQVANINGDAAQDLILVGLPEGEQQRRIFYLPSFSKNEVQSFNFQLSSFDSPYYYDINSDGLLDLLIGTGEGSLEYYKNEGSSAQPNFVLQDDSFYGIDISFTKRGLVPVVGDLNGDGAPDLVTTDATGVMTIYPGFMSHLSSPQQGIVANYYNSEADESIQAKLGIYTSPTVVDLYSSGTPLIVLGTAQGGVLVLKNTEAGKLGSNANQGIVAIYPNPGGTAVQNGVINIAAVRSVNVRIVSAIGKIVLDDIAVAPELPLQLDAKSLSTGVYIVIASDKGGEVEIDRFVVVD